MRAAWLACMLVMVATPIASASGRHPVYAIVIGNNAPPPAGTTPETLRPLRYADDDAVRYYQLFTRFADTHLLVVADESTQRRYPDIAARAVPPTADNLRRVVDELAAEMQRDRERGDRPTLYFAFSGHGARDDHGHAFLALLDAPLTQDMLYELLGRLPTEYTHVIVDACHAGGVVGVRGGTGFFANEADTHAAPATAADIEPILEATPLARHPNIGVIIATTLGEESHEWSAVESGVFTHELLSGLAGAADVNGDLAIEYSEIQAFVAAANRDIPDPRAVPHIIARPPAGNLRAPIITLRELAGTHLVTGDASQLGHFHIELENGQRYLDAHFDRGAITLAVPDGTPAFLRTDDREVALPARGAIGLAKLVLAPLASSARGSIDSALRSSLFASSFGRAYYEGFVDSTGAIGVTFDDASERDARAPARGRRLALGLAVVAGAAAATSLTTGVLAYRARADYNTTSLQRPADDAKQRYARYLPISIAAGATAAIAGVAAYVLWPRASVHVVPTAEAGGAGLGMEVAW